MVMINLTKDEANYLFWRLAEHQADGDEQATGIIRKIPSKAIKKVKGFEG